MKTSSKSSGILKNREAAGEDSFEMRVIGYFSEPLSRCMFPCALSEYLAQKVGHFGMKDVLTGDGV